MIRMLLMVTGKDRPGIIAKVSGLLSARGCNLEDVSMTLLEGQFAMMMTVCFPSQTAYDRVAEAFHLLESFPWSLNFHLTCLRGKTMRGKKHARGSLPQVVTVFGKDRTGIVHEVSRTLAALQVNITDLDSRILGAGSKTTYVMVLEVDVPRGTDWAALRKSLKRLASKLGIEIQMKPLEQAVL